MGEHPYHEGEIAVQERAGEREIALRRVGGISSRIGMGALSFLGRQRFLSVSTAADDGQLWTTVWCGAPGFLHSADGQQLTFRRTLMQASADDPILSRGLSAGQALGVLAIELSSRRRLRINGTVLSLSNETLEMTVRESVPNCPNYVEARQLRDIPASVSAIPGERGFALDDPRAALIARADTAFVGSVHPARGLDTSHRGGPPGFIQVVDVRTLRIPDYPGNSMFLTLGNFSVDPRASLTALDFERRRALALSGSVALRFGAEDPNQSAGGTGRYWDFTVEQWVEFALPSSMGWERLDPPPHDHSGR